ncbi:MAG: LpqN/LpqT family lipoprotein [Actinobacteria bacterium]|nr:LpqN/LpqT family lipoprotein [Actinomycetota bacterium]
MIEIARRWRVLAGGAAVGLAAVVGLAGATAWAEPTAPQPVMPDGSSTLTQTVTMAPAATNTDPLGAVPTTGGEPLADPGLAGTAVVPPTPQTILPAASGTLRDFFNEKGVRLEPQSSQNFTALNITLPMPPGWTHVPDPNVPDAFAVIADRTGGDGLYTSNAQVVLYKLVGDFDPKEAISHGLIDSQQLPAWRTTDASLADYGGMPSSLIEGTFRDTSMTVNTSRRHVIATTGPDNYLVTLSVSTGVDQAVAAADATDAIVTGFRVAVPGAVPPAPVAPPPAAAPPLPAAAAAPAAPATPAIPQLPALPQMLGLPG